jgi:hypothetical protein
VVFDSSVDSLQAFSEGLATVRYSELLSRLPALIPLDSSNSRMRYSGLAPLCGELLELVCWSQGSIFQIDVQQRPVCRIDLISSHIELIDAGSYDERLNLEIVTGPAMMLMLANQGIYSLHGGAVKTKSAVAGFIAESGVGKSTLSAGGGSDWLQLCDDIMPLQRYFENAGQQFFLEDYPQLKLPGHIADLRPAGRAQVEVVFRLNPEPSDEIKFRRMEKTEAMLQIVRHTVAAKLFNRTMMKDHARFAKRLSTAVPMFELSYPRDMERLTELRLTITEHMESVLRSD